MLLIEISYHVREQLWRKRCALSIKESCHLIVPELLSQSSQKPGVAEPSLILTFFGSPSPFQELCHSKNSESSQANWLLTKMTIWKLQQAKIPASIRNSRASPHPFLNAQDITVDTCCSREK